MVRDKHAEAWEKETPRVGITEVTHKVRDRNENDVCGSKWRTKHETMLNDSS